MTAFRVVVADDVGALRKLLRLALETGGRFQVVAEAGTGRQAVEAAQREHPDLVLLDLSMPELDGLEALPLILAASPQTRVVVLSGFQESRMGPVALRLGASAYLEKGMEPDELVRRLLAVLEPEPSEPPKSDRTGRPPAREGGAPRTASPSTFHVLVVAGADTARLELDLGRSSAARFTTVGHPDLASACRSLTTRQEHPSIDGILVSAHVLPRPPGDALVQLLTAAGSTPVVLVVPDGDQVLVDALRLGVEDCVPASGADPAALGRSLLYARERRRAQEARLTMRDQRSELARLRGLEDLKARFFNAAAHELGTPLTPMRLQIRLLRDHPMLRDPSVVRSLDILDRNIERLAKLTKELLEIGRLQAGTLRLEPRPVRLAELVREVADSLQPVAQAQGVHLDAACDADDEVEADPKGVVQVLYNLVHNALKFTPRDGMVEVRCAMRDEEAVVSVRDTGPGLVPDQVARLFQPFSQVLGDAQPAGAGTGLGLFISRGIVELHSGRIWCESQGKGHGSTFAFAIPRHATHPAARPPDAAGVSHGAPARPGNAAAGA